MNIFRAEHLHHRAGPPGAPPPLPHQQDVDRLNGLRINGVTMKITMLIATMMAEHAVTTTFQV